MALTTYLEAIRQGIWEEMERDESVFVLGEDVGIYGGAFKITNGMLEKFGERRVVDTPISESGIVGAAIGAALMGMRRRDAVRGLHLLLLRSDHKLCGEVPIPMGRAGAHRHPGSQRRRRSRRPVSFSES
jgi:Transketolase, pyrimidine binding domain